LTHKTTNVLNKVPKSQQWKATRALQKIWLTEVLAKAMAGLDAFIERYQLKYDKVTACRGKGRNALLAFYDFPGEH
jgi:putative transposase